MIEVSKRPPAGHRYRAALRSSVGCALLLAVALLLYLVTGDSILSVVVACSKFGWEDFATATWLWCNDPRIPRARTSFLFYVSIGLVRAFGATIAVIIAVTIAAGLAGIRAPALGNFQAGAVILSTQALVLLLALMTTSWAALACALKDHLRPWTDKTVHELRANSGIGPPKTFRASNATWVLQAALWSSVVVLPTLYEQFMGWFGVPLNGNDAFPILFIFFLLSVAAFLYLQPRIEAVTPYDFWPEDEPPWGDDQFK